MTSTEEKPAARQNRQMSTEGGSCPASPDAGSGPIPIAESTAPWHKDSPQWLQDAVFYEIYPQSFYDSNGDGIGDIPGITQKLGYIQSLGCNALWINPCFDSPFKDAGDDVRNYKLVAPRYGTNDDLIGLFSEAHRRGMHVLLDLVPGHTSEDHEWFTRSSSADPGEFADRYIWTDSAFSNGDSLPFIGGESERDATYILSFFKCQPALNYGFARTHKPWQQPAGSRHAVETEAAMVDIMRFWLSRGCDGFRVDMADSLVKFDPDDKPYTVAAWKRMLAPVREEFPQAAFVSEWGRPWLSLKAGFDMDFYLDWRWGNPNGYNQLLRDTDTPLVRDGDKSYFNADSGTSPVGFLKDYLPQYERSHSLGSFSFLTCNHDTPRIAPRLTAREISLAYGMVFTMPGIPFLYYGDEPGMHYRDIPTKEGGYRRTGSRTPMQWAPYNAGASPSCGFSSADPSRLYLPVDISGADDGINVESQDADPHSLLNTIRDIISLRRAHPALSPSSELSAVFTQEDMRSLAYTRTDPKSGESVLIAVNPGTSEEAFAIGTGPAAGLLLRIGGMPCWETIGGETARCRLHLPPQTFAAYLMQ